MAEEAYRSQSEYGPRGHFMCTAVSYVLAHAYLRGSGEAPPERFFTPEVIDRAMRACHDLFEHRNVTAPLMLHDMQAWFPLAHPEIRSNEVAGLTTGGPVSLMTPAMGVLPLTDLVDCMRVAKGKKKMALVVTYGGHTRLLVTPEGGGAVWLIDPLHPRPRVLYHAAQLALPSAPEEFAGVLLTR